MARGCSLNQDLKLLVNNPKYSDIEILCKDEKKLYGCRAILAARSEVLDGLLYNGMKETYETQISFPTINSSGMEIILEYVYTGSVREESLTKDNTVEAFYAADYFQLPELQDFIMKVLKCTLETNYLENYSPELLTKVSEKMPLTEDNILLNLLVEAVAIIPLNDIEFGRLSITGLKYLLSITHEKEIPFATREYEVFRYSAILAAKQVSNNTYRILMERLPILEQIDNSITTVGNKIITDREKVAKELEPLVKFIDFRKIKVQILADFIEPLEIISDKIISNVYRFVALLNNLDLCDIRGKLTGYVWDETACGSKLVIEDNGKTIHAQNSCGYQNVRAKIALENKGIFDWDVIIEKIAGNSCVGICVSENLNYETFAGYQSTGWVLSSNGYCYNSNTRLSYCPSFGSGTKITVHLDMNKRTCAFTVNGTKYPEVLAWNNLPSKLYPIVSLCYPSRFRIQLHQKN
ncbi:unnamed protein product [Rhizophagus irregularis]|nr:unnamed protein product [Rhizophagus irregularis]